MIAHRAIEHRHPAADRRALGAVDHRVSLAEHQIAKVHHVGAIERVMAASPLVWARPQGRVLQEFRDIDVITTTIYARVLNCSGLEARCPADRLDSR